MDGKTWRQNDEVNYVHLPRQIPGRTPSCTYAINSAIIISFAQCPIEIWVTIFKMNIAFTQSITQIRIWKPEMKMTKCLITILKAFITQKLPFHQNLVNNIYHSFRNHLHWYSSKLQIPCILYGFFCIDIFCNKN